MLKNLSLNPVYDSADHDLVNDLIVPLLTNSIEYRRGVGFFTSGWLRLAAQGLTQLIENGGTASIILSPIMEKRDWEAFQLGEQAKQDQALKNSLLINFEDMLNGLETETLNALAWMIADDILEFKFAVPVDWISGGDYHDKVAVFIDKQGSKVAIHGSFNDSIKGSLNGEAFSVFKSWEAGQVAFVEQHEKRLRQLWECGNRQFHIRTIPDAVKHKLIQLRSSESRPYKLKPTHPVSSSHNSKFELGERLISNLRDYQKEAIAKWVSAGSKGIFEMATGTGKTITSLAAAVQRYKVGGRIALIILVPYLHLLEQWGRNCLSAGFIPLMCSSEQVTWPHVVKSKVQDFNIRAIDNICILAVHKTAASDKFHNVTRGLKPDETMIIGDEAHGLGASYLRKAMLPNANMRLGLSATPRRWFDDEGTNEIISYFGQTCYEYSLEQAIGKFLTPYEYLPVLVSLTAYEMEEYEELTEKLSKLFTLNKKDPTVEENVKKILLRRALLTASAENKAEKLLSILGQLKQEYDQRSEELGHILIYCAPGGHKEILKKVSDLGFKYREFVHTVNYEERQKILDEFAQGDVEVLIAVKCLDEGVDVPATRMAFFLASTSNPREFVQRRGRVLRLSNNKSKASIYDFIVVPREEQLALKRDIDAGLLRREMPRFAEFASLAVNQFEARSKLWKLVNHYEMLNLFDEKPWEMYQRISKKNALEVAED